MMRFDETKSATLNLRVSPMFKKAVRFIAERESRSVPNALEWMVIDYFERNGLNESDLLKNTTKKKNEASHARR